MKITDIKQQVKDKGRYSIYVDGKFEFGMSQMGLYESNLRIGKELSKVELETFRGEAKLDKTYNNALGLLARRPRSKWELETYLKRKVPEEVESILNKLSSNGFVNDEDFARRWVENRHLLKPISRKKLRVELKQKRISESIINQVLNDDENDESMALKELILKKRQIKRYQDDLKLMQYLTGQGFNYQDIKQCISELET